jgi:hypothetical protein
MDERDPPMAFRASPEDRKIIADLRERLSKRLGRQTASGIIRLALRRLYAEENRRLKK